MADLAATLNPASFFYQRTPEEVHSYMQEDDLVWHEKVDMHTIQPIPRMIHAAFPHTGGIGYKKQIFKLSHRIYSITCGKWKTIRKSNTLFS